MSPSLSGRETPAQRDAQQASALALRLGPHPTVALGIDLASRDALELERWLLLACLLDPRSEPQRAQHAYLRLAEAGHLSARRLARADPLAVEALLGAAELPRPAATAQQLLRLAASLAAPGAVSLDRLASEADSLDALAASLMGLSAGFGRASVARFLRPLRGLWPVVDDLPLDRAALAAARHLGLISEGVEPEWGADALRSRLDPSVAPTLRDLEWALERLGRTSCLNERPARCPLGAECPMRGAKLDARA